MIQIPASSPTAIPAAPSPQDDDTAASSRTSAHDTALLAQPNGPASADPKAKFDALFGAPSSQRLYADANGAGGGRANTTKATKKTVDPMVNAAVPGQKGVVVERSLGDPRGYDTKFHALAWARAVHADRAMVVLGKDNRWHAVETNQVAVGGTGTGTIRNAIQVGKVDQAKYDALKAATQGNDPAAWKAFAAYALGVSPDEIEVIGKGDTPSSTRININLSPDFNAEGRTANFDPKQPPWVQLGPAAFDRPANAAATLAHEEVHAQHRRLTLDLYTKYQESPHGRETFRQWVATHAKDYRAAEIVAGYEDGRTAATELEAHVEAARVAFASGDLQQARTDLNKVATLPVLPQIQKPSIDALKALRDGLPEDARRVFNEVAAKAPGRSVLHGL